MKKIAFYMFAFASILAFTNCSDEIEFNNPAIQANKDGEFWRARYQRVDIDYGGWLIEGGNYGETLQLVTRTDTRGTFIIGEEDLSGENEAIFRDSEGVIYSTAFEPDPSLSVYPAEGQIIVDNITNTTPKRVFGTFWFTAYSEDGMKSVTFNQGVFYRAPLTDGLVQITNHN